MKRYLLFIITVFSNWKVKKTITVYKGKKWKFIHHFFSLWKHIFAFLKIHKMCLFIACDSIWTNFLIFFLKNSFFFFQFCDFIWSNFLIILKKLSQCFSVLSSIISQLCSGMFWKYFSPSFTSNFCVSVFLGLSQIKKVRERWIDPNVSLIIF